MGILALEFDLTESNYVHFVSDLISTARGSVSDESIKDYLLGNLDAAKEEEVEAAILVAASNALDDESDDNVESIYNSIKLEQETCSNREYELELVFM